MIPISGYTRFVLMLGEPVTQVKTPTAFAAWASSNHLDIVMIPVSVSADRLGDTLRSMRGWANCCGAVVTYPHKQAVAADLDEASEAVQLLGSCNVVRRSSDGRLLGEMTDGAGFVLALRGKGVDPYGRDVHVVGAGGAGSAIALGLLSAGVRRLLLTDRDPARAEQVAARLAKRYPNAVLRHEPSGFACTLVCNATPVGMGGENKMPISLDGLASNCVIADIVPDPALTPWLLEAQRRGHLIQTGPEMIEAQLPAIVAHLFPQG